MSKQLFISKSKSDLKLLPEFCSKNNIKLAAHSFLSFETINFKIDFEYDIIFFTSPRSVEFFLKKYDLKNKLIATAGKSTANKIIELTNIKKIDFISKNSGNINSSSNEFAIWTKNKKVLFPISNLSEKSYTLYLNPEMYKCVEIYKTNISTKLIENQDIYVFTSPSNVKGFLKSNFFPDNSKIIAWGETTYNELKKYIEINKLITLQESSEECLLKQLLFL
jgi:uroporphyrinogen-III synthase